MTNGEPGFEIEVTSVEEFLRLLKERNEEPSGQDRHGTLRRAVFIAQMMDRRPSSQYQSDREHLRSGEGSNRFNQGAGLQRGRLGDDLQGLGSRRRGRWTKLGGSHPLAPARSGARFVNRELVEGDEQENREEDAA